jgi:hypothetical protein
MHTSVLWACEVKVRLVLPPKSIPALCPHVSMCPSGSVFAYAGMRTIKLPRKIAAHCAVHWVKSLVALCCTVYSYICARQHVHR